MNIQILRNLTTGRLHTKMEDIYEAIEFITGESGIMTHQIPNAYEALEPWLKERVKDSKFWEDALDLRHTGEFRIDPMTPEERAEFFKRYKALP